MCCCCFFFSYYYCVVEVMVIAAAAAAAEVVSSSSLLAVVYEHFCVFWQKMLVFLHHLGGYRQMTDLLSSLSSWGLELLSVTVLVRLGPCMRAHSTYPCLGCLNQVMVCVCVCLCVCMYVWMWVCVCVCCYICICVPAMYVCVSVCCRGRHQLHGQGPGR